MKKSLLFFYIFLSFFALTTFDSRGEEKNAVIVPENSLETFGWGLEFIREAKHSIELSNSFVGGKVFQEMLTEMEARLEVYPDLEVFVLISPMFLEKGDFAMIDYLRNAYPDNFHLTYAAAVGFIWPDIGGTDNHIKMLVVDERYFLAGGTNFDELLCQDGTFTPPRYHKPISVGGVLPAGMRDQDIVGRGPIAKQMRQLFHQNYALWEHYNKKKCLEKDPDKFKRNHYKPIDVEEQPFVVSFEGADQLITLEEGQIQAIFGGPHQKSNEITKKYSKLIKNAKEEIVIANLNFCPVDNIFKHLL